MKKKKLRVIFFFNIVLPDSGSPSLATYQTVFGSNAIKIDTR